MLLKKEILENNRTLKDKNKELKEEIKRLMSLWKTDRQSWNELMAEKEIEIDKLKELCNKYEEEHKTVFEEWKKTIDIIDEFESWLNNIPNYFMDRRSNNTGVYVQKGMQQMIDMCKNKLQELKGSDKE